MEKDFVVVDGGQEEFFYIRKRIKNLNLRVDIDGRIVVSMPMRMSVERAKEFISQKYGWIKKVRKNFSEIARKRETVNFENGEILYLLGGEYTISLLEDKVNKVTICEKVVEIRVKERYFEDKDYIRRMYESWLKKFGMTILLELTEKYQGLINSSKVPIPKIEIRKMKRRWGCCFPKSKKIVFNMSLIKVPIECIEYVVLHELSHFVYQNHSKNFYEFVATYMPDWKERKRVMDRGFTGVV